jgi:hypothetical protein
VTYADRVFDAFDPANIEWNRSKISLRELPAKPPLRAAEAKERVRPTDRRPYVLAQHWPAECTYAAVVAPLARKALLVASRQCDSVRYPPGQYRVRHFGHFHLHAT